MIPDSRAAATIAVVALVTIALRLAPFIFMKRFAQSGYLAYLSESMPVGVMFLLVAYTFLDVDLTTWPYGLPLIGSVFVLLVVQFLTRNVLLAIGAGLFLHVYLVS